MVLGDSVKTE
jgi:hypothetical protein